MDDSDADVAILLHMGATKEILEPILDPCSVIYEFCQEKGSFPYILLFFAIVLTRYYLYSILTTND